MKKRELWALCLKIVPPPLPPRGRVGGSSFFSGDPHTGSSSRNTSELDKCHLALESPGDPCPTPSSVKGTLSPLAGVESRVGLAT